VVWYGVGYEDGVVERVLREGEYYVCQRHFPPLYKNSHVQVRAVYLYCTQQVSLIAGSVM
jgi:hypothetical protein